MAYVLRYTNTTNGAITFTGNTLGLSKEVNANAPGTSDAIGAFITTNTALRDGTYPFGTTEDWTLNSASAVLRLPPNSVVLYAELIWGGSYNYGGTNVSAFLNNPITFITPLQTVSVTRDVATAATQTDPWFYVRSANVTSLVAAAGAGTYTVGGVPGTQSTSENTSNHTGWTLAVVYQNAGLPARNMSFFVGAELTTTSNSPTSTVSGFATPPTGALSGRLLVSAQEGDSNRVGDQFRFGPTVATLAAISGPNNPIDNFFASQINDDNGLLDTSGTFGNLNHPLGSNASGRRQGWDITNVDVSARLVNNQTTAVARGTTSGDVYLINGLGIQINVNAPTITAVKSVDQANALISGILNYTVVVSNTGTANANNVLFRDFLQSNISYIPGTLTVNGVTQPSVDLDAGVPLGDLPIGGSATVRFQVQINSYPASGVVNNTANFAYGYQSTAGGPIIPGLGQSNTVSTQIINRPPIVPNYSVTTPQSTLVGGTVVATDPDGQVLTYSQLTNPTNGTATVDINGNWSYTPNPGFVGVDNFTVQVSDGAGGTATSTITITVTRVNNPPTVPDYSVFTTMNTPANGTVIGNDIDGNTLTYTLLTNANNGTVVVNSNGDWTYQPNLNYVGLDSFTVLVDDGFGGTAVSTINVNIESTNSPPSVPNYVFTTSHNTSVSGNIIGTDPDGDTLTYGLLTQGIHGTAAVNPDGSFTYTPNPSFVGTDSFTVSVSDGLGGTAVSTVTINVINDPPFAPDYIIFTAVDISVSGNIVGTDPNNDPLTYSLATNAMNGIAVVNPDGSWTYTPNPGFVGADSFTVLVDDGKGGSYISTVNIKVYLPNRVPVVPNYNAATIENIPVSGVVVGVDPEGGNLIYSKFTDPSNGTATVDINGNWTYTPNAGFIGTDSFTVSVADEEGAVAISTITITVTAANRPPSVPDYTVSTAADTPVSGQVIGTDPDGDLLVYSKLTDPSNGTVVVLPDGSWTYTPNTGFSGTDSFTVLVSDGLGGTDISIININVAAQIVPPIVPSYNVVTPQGISAAGTVTAVDLNGLPLTYSQFSSPANGTASVDSNGNWIYTPNLNFTGTDEFFVLVTNSAGGSTLSKITITVVNQPPTAPSYNVTTFRDTPVTGAVVGIDPNGDALIYTEFSAPTNGTVTVNNDGTWTYTPNSGFVGTDNFIVLVSDGRGGTDLSAVNIVVLQPNTPPTVPDYNLSILRNAVASGAVVGTDIDGNTLTYSLLAPPSNGSATVNSDGTWTYIPVLNFVGTDSFTVLVDDGEGGTAVSTITINVQLPNQPPTAPDYYVTTPEATEINGQVIGTDPDGDILTYSALTGPANGSLTVNSDGTWSYTPRIRFVGPDSFTVLIEDGRGGAIISTVFVEVTSTNTQPTVPNYDVSTSINTPVNGQIVGFDPDGDPLVYNLLTPPQNGIAIVDEDGNWSYTPNTGYTGLDSFTVRLVDGRGGAAVSVVNINIDSVNSPPTAPDYSLSSTINTQVAGQVIGTDPDGDTLVYSLLTGPANGTTEVRTDGTWIFTPTVGFTGTVIFRVLVSDGQGGSAVSNITINIPQVNGMPTVPNYFVEIQEGGTAVGTVVGTDPDGDTLIYSLLNAPQNGRAVVASNGQWQYTPNPGFSGNDFFTVFLDDGNGGTVSSVINITVNPNLVPPTVPDYRVVTERDTAVQGTVVATDIYGDTLTYSLFSGPSYGTVIVNPDGSWEYTPNTGFLGADYFSVLVSGGRGGDVVSNIKVNVVPDGLRGFEVQDIEFVE